MATTGLRLTKGEQKKIEEIYFKINNLRIKKGLRAFEESEIIHKILELSMGYVTLGENGELVLSHP